MTSSTVRPDVPLATPLSTSVDITLATAQVTSGAAEVDATGDVTLATAQVTSGAAEGDATGHVTLATAPLGKGDCNTASQGKLLLIYRCGSHIGKIGFWILERTYWDFG